MRRLIALTLFISWFVPAAWSDEETAARALQQLRKQVVEHTLDNGVRIIMYRRGSAPVFAGAVVVGVGGVNETPGQTGISHLLEHMAFKGTPQIGVRDAEREAVLLGEIERIEVRRSAGEQIPAADEERLKRIYEELRKLWVSDEFTLEYDRHGAVGLNATTGKETTNYFVELPRQAFEFWCRMESERLLNPVMRQFYEERNVVMEERRMRFEDDPDNKLYEALLGVAFLQHPYRNPVIGYADDIRNLTATETAAFHKSYYVPGNIVISVVGEVDPDKDIEVLRRYFGRLPVGPAVDKPHITEPAQQGERRITLRADAAPALLIAYKKPPFPDADDPAISVMNEMLAGGPLSPLHTELVKKREMIADYGQWEDPGVVYPHLFAFKLTPKLPHSSEEVLHSFDEVISQFKSREITAERLAIARRRIGMEYLGHIRSNLSLALDFASSEVLFNSWDTSLEWYNQAMQVTLADVQRVASKYLEDSQRTVGVLATREEGRE